MAADFTPTPSASYVEDMTHCATKLRVLIDPVSHVETVAMGVWFGVGTRDEQQKELNGIAHLVEHMVFKGTKTRSALDIVHDIEKVGAQINAYTGRELTAYTVYGLKDDLRTGLNILNDMIRNSIFLEKELKLEQDVIVQEIGMVADTPDDIIHDDAFTTAFPDQAFGRPVLGHEKAIRGFTPQDLHNYVRTHYHPGCAVVSIAGNVDILKASDMVADIFSGWKADPCVTREQAVYRGGTHRAERALEQTHILYGFPSVSRGDSRQTALSLYIEAMGGGMASRLFQEIREKRGLAYSVYASNQTFADTGFLNVYAGTDPAKAQDCLNVIRDELMMGAVHIKEDDLQRAKTQRKAGLLMAQESMMARADRQARQQLLHGRLLPISETIAKIDAVTLEEIDALCKSLIGETPTLALRGPKVESLV